MGLVKLYRSFLGHLNSNQFVRMNSVCVCCCAWTVCSRRRDLRSVHRYVFIFSVPFSRARYVRSALRIFFFPTPILYLLFIFVIVVLLCCFCWLCIWQAYGIMSSAMGCCWIWSRIRNGLQNTFFGPIIEDNVLTLDAGWQYEILDLETSTYPT